MSPAMTTRKWRGLALYLLVNPLDVGPDICWVMCHCSVAVSLVQSATKLGTENLRLLVSLISKILCVEILFIRRWTKQMPSFNKATDKNKIKV